MTVTYSDLAKRIGERDAAVARAEEAEALLAEADACIEWMLDWHDKRIGSLPSDMYDDGSMPSTAIGRARARHEARKETP